MGGAAPAPPTYLPATFPPQPPTRDELAQLVFGRALLRGTFTLRSGATSDRYFDKYLAATDPRLLRPLAAALADAALVAAPDAQVVVAPELGAVPLATALSIALGLPFAIVRSHAKGYGTAKRIEGELPAGARALLVEDVVTSGGAALEALAVAREAGAHIDTALCVLDRSTGGEVTAADGRDALLEAGVVLHALLDAGDLDRAFAAGIGRDVDAHG